MCNTLELVNVSLNYTPWSSSLPQQSVLLTDRDSSLRYPQKKRGRSRVNRHHCAPLGSRRTFAICPALKDGAPPLTEEGLSCLDRNTDARINGRHASSILEMRSEVLPLAVLSISTYWSMETLTLLCKSALGAEGSQPSWQEERGGPGIWASVLSGVWWTSTASHSPLPSGFGDV